MENKFRKLFAVEKPIIGMIHLAGNCPKEKLDRAIRELELYQEEGVNGAIVEDYHADGRDLIDALKEISKRKWNIKLGINFLRNPFAVFEMAKDYGTGFIQLDSVQGIRDSYAEQRKRFPNLVVLGGVRFKYQPATGRTLEEDLEEGKPRCDAVVTTGEGTGIETPIEKLKQFRKLLGNYSLIVGAGVNLSNVCEQLRIADGAIIGSYFKPDGDTHLPVDRGKVKSLMYVVRELRSAI
jgi:hypothetical protein